MAVERFETTRREPFAGGRVFADGRTYERLDGLVHYAVDPENEANSRIIDFDLAPRDADGRVRFFGDGTILVPSGGGNGAALLDVPNRGHRVAPRMFGYGPDVVDDRVIDPGDGFLFDAGWTVAFCAWQWDVPRDAGRMGLDAPRVAEPDGGEMQLRFQVSTRCSTLALTDQHLGSIGNHLPIPPAAQAEANGRMTVRDAPLSAATPIDRDAWRFVATEPGARSEKTHVELDGGFEPGRIYDLVYRPAECPVVGCGLLAMRDFAAWLKSPDRPVESVEHVIGDGVSQCGRFLRTYLFNGLNVDEQDQQAFDGLLIHVAGGRCGEFNHRYAQPSVQPTPSFGHLFPFADEPQQAGDANGGLLDRQRAVGGVPKIFTTDTSAEYWRGDAGLTHINLGSGDDVAVADDTRRYLFSSTQHATGVVPLIDENSFGRGANPFNAIDYRPLIRAALVNLLRWVKDDVEPPPSAFPQLNDGTAARRADVIDRLASIQSPVIRPDETVLNRIHPLALDAADGIADMPAEVCREPWPTLVSAIDEDGNETAGIPMPDVTVPVGTHTGFNPRHPETGGAGQVLHYAGSTRFFPRDEVLRRYGSRDAYLERIRAAADELVGQRYLLEGDIGLCVELAGARFDAATGETGGN